LGSLRNETSRYDLNNVIVTSSQSHFTTDSHSVNMSVRLGAEPLWFWSRQLRFCLSWGVLSDERTGLSCNSSQSLSVSSNIHICTFYIL